MNNTMKITSLVAVLALCCAALAGSAYAYTATYVDTIDAQPIESVYVTINDKTDGVIAGYGGADVDVMYDTLTTKTVTEGVATYATTYKLAGSVDSDVIASNVGFTTKTVDRPTQTVTLAGVIDAVRLKAYGDSTSGALTLTISGATGGNWSVVNDQLTYSDKEITATFSVVDSEGTVVSACEDNVITVSSISLNVDKSTHVSDERVYKLNVSIVVNQLTVSDGQTYFAVKNDAKGDDGFLNPSITIPGFSIEYLFTGSQTA